MRQSIEEHAGFHGIEKVDTCKRYDDRYRLHFGQLIDESVFR